MERGRLRRRGLAAAGALALAALAVASSGCGAGDQRTAPPVATVVVDATRPGRAIPRSFLGVATEWDSIAAYAGPPRRRRAALVALLRQVGRAQRGPVALRIGGDAGDQAWWNPGRQPRPPTVLHDLGPRVVGDAAWLARRLGGPVTLGLNLALGDDRNAVALARALRRRIGRRALAAVELGNEPDLYGRPGRRWHVPGYVHVRLRKRPAGYGPGAYGREAQRLQRAVRAGLGRRVHVVAAGFAGPAWWPALPRLLRGWRPPPDVLAGHLYAWPRCGGLSPGPDWLMAGARARESAAWLAPLGSVARSEGLPWRVSELNSAPCGGRAGMSDAPAAALWLADTLFALAAAGAEQVDVQSWNHAWYELATLTRRGAQRRPPLDGMLAFAKAAPAGSRLVRTSAMGGGDIRARATVDARGVLRVLVVAPHGADVRLRRAAGGARCGRAWVAEPGRHAQVAMRPVGDACRLLVPAESLAVIAQPHVR